MYNYYFRFYWRQADIIPNNSYTVLNCLSVEVEILNQEEFKLPTQKDNHLVPEQPGDQQPTTRDIYARSLTLANKEIIGSHELSALTTASQARKHR